MFKRIARIVLFLIVIFAAVVFLNDFTRWDSKQAIRSNFNVADCGTSENPINIASELDLQMGTSWDCGLAHFRSDVATKDVYMKIGTQLDNDWVLSFLEFDENGKLKDRRQLQYIKSHLEIQKQNFLIVYIHGWRHDAAMNDEDVSDFRKLLSYSKSFVNYRCEVEGKYCDAAVTGVYVGWPGSTTWFDGESQLASAVTSFTLPFRKNTSERISKRVVNTIADVETSIRKVATKEGDPKSKMLVIGHSLGGNLLISTLGPLVKQQVQVHEPTTVAKAPLGDLTVLINPAAEASKWTAIQRAFRGHPAVALDVDNIVQGESPRTFYPTVQPPLMVSITSVCYYPLWFLNDPTNEDMRKDGTVRTIDCDSATGTMFPIFSSILNADRSRENTRTIGNLVPKLTEKTDMLGVTHEMEIDRKTTEGLRRTIFNNASVKTSSLCEPVPGWLYNARTRIRDVKCKGNRWGAQWDSGYEANNHPCRGVLDFINKKLSITAQFRHGIFRNVDRGKHGDMDIKTTEITGPNDPYWNVRAMDNAISGHNGYVSYPTWCAINQLVLDDIVDPPAQH